MESWRDYFLGKATALKETASSALATAKSTVSGWLDWGSPQQQAEGVYFDFAGNPYLDPALQSNTPKKAVSQSRLATQAAKDTTGQAGGGGDGCNWYHALNPLSQCNTITKAVTQKASTITTGIGETFSSVGGWVSSTLTKTIIILVIVGIGALFLYTFIQAKGAQLAKAH